MKQNAFSTPRGRKPSRAMGFTLVELLVVIAIMGLVAAMVLGLAGMAGATERRKRVVAQRDQLITAIEAYKKDHGVYPPDNTNSPAMPPLYYELRGATLDPATGLYSGAFPNLTKVAYTNFFGRGIVNAATKASAGDPEADKSKDHIAGVRPQQSTNFTIGTEDFMFFIVGLESAAGTSFKTNTWRYVSTHPTNNVGHYDLWADVIIKGKPETIGNWNN